MSILSRLRRLEDNQVTHQAGKPCGCVPWYIEKDHPGPICNGERITWDEYERRFPRAPKPLRWLGNPMNVPKS